MSMKIKIGRHKVGANLPCFIIAEAGVNHNGKLDLALQLVDAAQKVGADAIKFQTFKAKKLVTPSAQKAGYQKASTAPDETQFEMLKKLELGSQDFVAISQHCQKQGIIFLSSPFDEESIDFLDSMGVPAFKIPSGEINNLPYLKAVGAKAKPVILSTGMSSMQDVEMAVQTLKSTGNAAIILLHCVSNYPADPADVNLRAMQTLRDTFGLPVGFSDHTMGIEIPLAAAALGACVIEKHVTLDRSLEGPDHKASIEPDELSSMVQGIRKIEAALGDGIKSRRASEEEIAAVVRKSLVAKIDLPAGTVIRSEMIDARRPGSGLPPTMADAILGRTLGVPLKAGDLFSLDMFL